MTIRWMPWKMRRLIREEKKQNIRNAGLWKEMSIRARNVTGKLADHSPCKKRPSAWDSRSGIKNPVR